LAVWRWLGRVPFAATAREQERLREQVLDGDSPETLLLCEHQPVVTLGRSAKPAHVLAPAAELARRGVDVHTASRGGDVTYHGPGQLVGYPIIDLKRHKRDLHWYLRQVEEALIRAIAPFGLAGERRAGLTGVWTEGRKLASIGVHARDWVTWHGFALNVTTDLRYFDLIVPCGIDAVEMSSVGRELERHGGGVADADDLLSSVKASVGAAFGDVFALDVADMHPHALLRVA